ncbi:hypothetical protein OTK49_01545 [Vibrio coralliirubri]|uniref:hypothetical protein n=1 Tax=Vibrio coralliirubri TaxID=1516159 RepID=UPI002283E8A7|nr:hypothetical protein [Vibrio coralliirubri]MCY9861209.1 hypothetical protein [Vibrio coralliirubri]
MNDQNNNIANILTGFIKRLAESHEHGYIPDNSLTIGQVYEVAKIHAMGEFKVELPELSELVGGKVATKAYEGNWRSPHDSDEHLKVGLGTGCFVRLDCGQDETVVVPATLVNGKFWSLDELRKHRHGGEPFSNVIEWSYQPEHFRKKLYMPEQKLLARQDAIDALISGKTITHITYAGGDHLSLVTDGMLQYGDDPTNRYNADKIIKVINKDESLERNWLILNEI